MKKFTPPKAWLIDIEGVLVKDKGYQPVDGAVAWLQEIHASGTPYCLVSNNTTDRPDELVDRLSGLGFPVTEAQLISVLSLGVRWLKERGRQRIMWLGNSHLMEFWEDHGFTLVASGSCDAVVLGLNPELEISHLDNALPALLDGGADLVCLHRNHFYLDAEGNRRLGPGSWAAALELNSGAGNVVTVGKPEEEIYRQALKRVGVEPEEALFISDDPLADLVMAKELGMTTVFTLSGKYTDHEILGRMDQEQWPDIIVSAPADLLA
jgi:5'-nucleotidase